MPELRILLPIDPGKEAYALTIVLLRTLVLYLLVIGAVRLMGKRQLGELQPSELVITILISNIATLSLEDVEIPLLHGILPILVLVCFEVISSWAALKSETVRRWISGTPKVIIRGGEIDQQMLRELRLTLDDLMTALRTNGVFDPDEVQYAIVETNGTVSLQLKPDKQPAQRGDVGVRESPQDPPHILIADGSVRDAALNETGLSRRWLDKLLQKRKLRISDVFLMTADSSGSSRIVPREGGTA